MHSFVINAPSQFSSLSIPLSIVLVWLISFVARKPSKIATLNGQTAPRNRWIGFYALRIWSVSEHSFSSYILLLYAIIIIHENENSTATTPGSAITLLVSWNKCISSEEIRICLIAFGPDPRHNKLLELVALAYTCLHRLQIHCFVENSPACRWYILCI